MDGHRLEDTAAHEYLVDHSGLVVSGRSYLADNLAIWFQVLN